MTTVEADEVLRQRARRVVYERLAAITALIWVLGTLVLVLTTVPVIERPVRQFATAMTIPLIPAAVPWLFYGFLSNRLAGRWASRAE